MTEELECVAFHAVVGQDAAAAKSLSDFFEARDPAPLEKDIAETDFMFSGEFFKGTMYGLFGPFRIFPFSDCCALVGGGDAMANGFLDRVMNQLTNELI